MSDAEYWDATPLQVRARFDRYQLQQHREWFRVAYISAALSNSSGFRKEGSRPAHAWDFCSPETRAALGLTEPNVHPDYKPANPHDPFAAMDEYARVVGGLNNQGELEAQHGGNPGKN